MADTPLGVRINNPLNIRFNSSNDWQGQVGSEKGFAQFDSPANGVRAADILVENYGKKYGLNSVRGLINRFAPPTENDTDHYVDFVSKQTGIGADDVVDVSDPKVRRQIITAMARMETGTNLDELAPEFAASKVPQLDVSEAAPAAEPEALTNLEEMPRRWEPQQTFRGSANPSQVAQVDHENREGPGAGEVLEAAFLTENATIRGAMALMEETFPTDPEFNFEEALKSDEVKARLDKMPIEAVEGLQDAVSYDNLEYLLSRVEEDWHREMLLASSGGGMPARMLAAVLDPVDWVAAGVGGHVGAAYKVSKLGRMVAAGAAGASGAAAAETVLAQTSPFRDGTDVAIAATAGLVLGAPFGLIGRGYDAELEALAREAHRAARAGSDVHVEGGAGIFHEHPAMRLAKNSENTAARNAAEEMDPAELIFNTPLPTRSHVLHGSADDEVRDLAFKIVETGTPIKGTHQGKRKRFTAEGRANLLHRTQATAMYRSIEANFKPWAQEAGYGRLRSSFGVEAGAKFREEVGRAVKGDTVNVTSHAQAAAKEIQELLQAQLIQMQKAGVKGADGIAPNANYLPRVHHGANWRAALSEFGEEGLVRAFREAFQRADNAMDLDVARKLAKGYVKSVSRQQFNIDVNLTHGIPLDDFDALRRTFGEEADEMIEALEAFKKMQTEKGGSGKIKNLKPRAQFDESVGVPILTKNGDTKLLKISDLMENDVGKVVDRYFRVTSGWVGLAREANLKGADDVSAAIKSIRSKGAETGRAAAEKEATQLEEVTKLVTGQHLEADPYSLGVQAGRSVRAYNFARVGGGFGWAQLAEMGNIIGSATVRHFFEVLPDARKMFKQAADGKLDNQLAAELEHALGAGTDFVRNPAISGFDEFGLGFDSNSLTGKVMGALDKPLQVGGRMTSVLSGMAPVNAWLQRAATRASAYRIGRMARKYGTLDKAPKYLRARFADMGLDESQVNGIFDAIKTHATFKGKRLEAMNFDQWNPKVFDDWRMSAHRQFRRVIQENDIGNSFPFMDRELGKILTQFQSFMINAIQKQTVHGIAMRDRETAVSWLMTMFAGTLAYTAQNSLNYASEPKKLKERLSPERLAAAAFMRAGWASIIPMGIDTGLGIAGQDKVFAHARSSGLGTGPLEGNPTYSLLRDAGNIAQLPGRLAFDDDYEFSQTDLRRMSRSAAFGNVTGVRNVISLLAKDLPKRSD